MAGRLGSKAQADDELRRLVREKAGLTRVATIVAEGVPAAELFAVLTQEVAHAVEVRAVSLARYEADRSTVVLASLNAPDFPAGARLPLDGDSLSATVFETGRPARAESDCRSEVGVPIVVDGEVWGLIRAGATSPEPLPADIETSLRDFTELVATGISKTESRDSLRRVDAEQAALRNVATLVAEGAAPAEVFGSVAQEVARILDVSAVSVVRFDSDTWSVVVASFNDPGFPVGSRWPLEGPSLNATVFTTGQPAQIDYSELPGAVAAAARSTGLRVGVGVPIVVEGRIWGMIAVGRRQRREALPAFAGSYTGRLVLSTASPLQTQARLAAFTELVATAISKAQAHDDLSGLAMEQAALRRVATLVASGARPGEVFPAVAREVGELFGVPAISMVRFGPDGSTTEIGGWGNENPFPPGTRFDSHPGVDRLIWETGRPARIHSYAELGGGVAEMLDAAGFRSAIAAPIVVDGRTWGAVEAMSQSAEPLPDGAEARLASFTELLSTAIANSDARDHIRRLADEQAALRRVATLAAEGAPPDALFRAVADEVASVVGPRTVTLSHHHADGTFTVVAETNNPGFPVGSRWPLDGPSLAATIHETGRVARIDDYSNLGGAVAAAMHDASMHAAAGSPIVVDGKVWGHISVAAEGTEPLPAGTEQRLLDFTELLSTAISNAESRDALARLADEQAALRRVATLVARDAPPGEVFGAVAMEVGTLLDTDITVVGRYDGDGSATAIGSWSSSPGGVPVGTRSALGGRNVLTLVAETERPARIDGYVDTSGEAADIARRHGWRSSIAAPISVEGRLWGVMLVASRRPEPFPVGAEERLAAFTDLVATALANAQAHDAVRRFGEEQAALGRVATLVAAGSAPEQVFKAVVEEASSLLGLDRIELVRYEPHTTATVIAASGDHPFPPGSTWSLDDQSVMATVARTGRVARIDDYSALKGEIARVARSAGFQSAIGAPLTVAGHLWGVIIAISTDPEPIPERSVARLGQFTELVATAVANAEAREALGTLANEQIALRRVATLVAEEVAPDRIFAAVCEQVAHLLEADITALEIFPGDGTATLIAAWSKEGLSVPVGKQLPLEPDTIAARIVSTHAPARRDTSDDGDVKVGPFARDLQLTSTVGAPILVSGRLWGALMAGTRRSGPWAEEAETPLAGFTELIATAIANAEARDALAHLADEQAALRRIATLVAEGVQPEAIFSAVGEEIGRLFGSNITTVGRFEPDAQALVALGVGTGNEGIAIGSRWELDDRLASAQVFYTGRSVRVDEVDWSALRGAIAPVGSRLGVASTVASPIFVEGRLWGVVSVSDQKPLPQDAEERLEKFSELIATAIANAESSAELAASRRRIVAAADEARRRIERDLHDGIQQRLIALTFRARAMTRKSLDELPGLVAELAEGLTDAADELREVARGIHPTILSEAGLGPALRALARRSNLPIDVDVNLDTRLTAPVEAAAYYIASEALTNVEKHADASLVQLIATDGDGILTLEVRDDGIGGVDAERGSGILGLTDRVEALGGTISITSPPGDGTTISVELPITTPVTP